MTETELHASDDGYVLCPRRGEISAEWCGGCPFRIRTEHHGDRTVVVCEPGEVSADLVWTTTMRDVPDLWR